ncbi:hypothetical protein [Fundidesulfovibrio terrae]|uniref:hypothetical protein n=1 Tax=Fundidesulfovibrio terrae TaxID=2922866 RepID=UPI001FAF154C|nr:hypothetical protein [Fundidesulfovibrio terrae]
MEPRTHALPEKLLFDRKDYELLGIVGDVLGREDLSGFKHLLAPYLHPRGVKELAASQGLRIAYAAANMLGSLEIGKAHDRINALRALRDEAMNASVTYLRRNTARVLMQIMKELVRTTGDRRRQLELAHDFRMAATGKPRVIARQLRLYRLLPMPEDWVQICFDNHVHDANTKGRKSATHLIMDAWIKGIRHLTVIYYHFVPPGAAEELLQAAEIMGISVRIGIEFITRFDLKQVKVIWVPKGFRGPADFLGFLREPAMARFMEQGRGLARLHEEQLLHVLDGFNANVLPDFNSYFGMDIPPASRERFLEYIGSGQASLLHLGKYLHAHIHPHLLARFTELQQEYFGADSREDKARIEGLVEEMNILDAEAIVDDYLDALVSPETPAPPDTSSSANAEEASDTAPLYCAAQPPARLIDEITSLRVGSRFILNQQDLECDDVLEVLHDCAGRITHLEVVNLKNSALGAARDSARVALLQQIINAKSVMPLKRWVMNRMAELEADPSPGSADRLERMARILENVPALHGHYRETPLRTSIGSDSTGQSCRGHGMGLVARETLPPAALREVRGKGRDRNPAMVVGMTVEPRVVYEPRESTNPIIDEAFKFARSRQCLRRLGYKPRRDFRCKDFFPTPDGDSNILIMGGVKKGCGNNFELQSEPRSHKRTLESWPYCNNHFKNILKVVAGFIPAFLTFFFTKDWWVLSWLGGFIWFGITGLRNIIQSVLGAGGLARTPLLRWNDYVSWSRLADSLLYTGFSVPLLDYFVKTLLLDRGLGINVATNATALYTTMALVNGAYICTHNLVRGLPRQAAFLNLLRSAFSIPLAMAVSAALAWAISPHDPAAAGAVLQQWAAVISKLCSDTVAAVIEGITDRDSNMRQRLRDYQEKIAQMLSVHERLEVLFPKSDVLAMLADPKQFVNTMSGQQSDLANAVIVNSLDFLYFWMYQPRGRSALGRVMREMDPQTRQIFVSSQYVLLRKREISQLFLDGLLGKNFSKGLAFYLDYADGYLDSLQQLAARTDPMAGGREMLPLRP